VVFKNLRTGTTLVILCGVFIAAISATTYSLITEKLISIEFARKELVGSRYLATVREIYATVLRRQPFVAATPPTIGSTDKVLEALAAAQERAGAALQTKEIAQALAEMLGLWSRNSESGVGYGLEVLAKARQLASRIADDSNLALDPDLDSFHVQDLVTRKLPAFLDQLGEMQVLFHEASAALSLSSEQKLHIQVLDPLLRSITDEMGATLAGAFRGNPDGSLKQAIDGAFATMISSTNAYLGGMSATLAGSDAARRDATAADDLYRNALNSAIGVWQVAQSELDRLVQTRIDGLLERMRWTLAGIGALAALSIVIAVMTHRHIVGPLERLEQVASAVRETKDYSLRIDYTSKNEIGQLSAAFNDMLSELAAARLRERSEQSELARNARLMTMGELTASIAHEVNQPLSAIVTNGSVGLGWLAKAQPNLDEVRAALKSIVDDGRRASEVIASVRGMFRKDSRERRPIGVNDLVRQVLALVHGELESQQVLLQTDLFEEIPEVTADPVQLQQVFLNLVVNAIEAMRSNTDRRRSLLVKSQLHEGRDVLVSVADSGPGIEAEKMDRIFEAFFTTKSQGMGMGLSICRSVVEAHNGRLWASAREPHGTVFHVQLPGCPSGRG
jgi:signal transduction histidine kinase